MLLKKRKGNLSKILPQVRGNLPLNNWAVELCKANNPVLVP